MPKGDRDLFKADIEDGYTKIADLLLEALAMAKLNGVQKGICLFIWRRTYGWGIKEDRIPLKDFAMACDTSESYISKQLKELEKKKVILRLDAPQGKASVFTINTRVAQWDKGCINVQGLNDCIRKGLYKCAIQGLHDCARVDTPPALEPQGIEPPLYTGLYTEKNNTQDTDNYRDTDSDKKKPEENENNQDTLSSNKDKADPNYFFTLDDHEKVEFLKTLPVNKQLALLVVTYNKTFPEQANKFGTGGVITARKVFEEAVKSGVPPEKILIEILWNQEEGEPTPWDLVNCLKGQRGLEQTQAQVFYSMEKYDREVGIKTYGKARDAPQH